MRLKNIGLIILVMSFLAMIPNISAHAVTAQEISKYTYEVTPLVSPFNGVLYLKTNNPDASSIALIDKDTKYSDEQTVFTLCNKTFGDVKYENASIFRVQGGYLFVRSSGSSDGGQLSIAIPTRKVVNSMWTTVYEDTGVVVNCPTLSTGTDYLIANYTNSSMSFWEKLTAVSNAMDSIAVYPFTVYDESKPIAGRYPYYGRSAYNDNTAPMLWQRYSGLYATSSFLLEESYPFVLDSASYPSLIASVAKELEPSCVITQSSYDHSRRKIAFGGEEHSYGGQGKGGSNPVITNDILYLFNGEANDYSRNKSIAEIANKLLTYKSLGNTQIQKYKEQLDTLYESGGWGKIAGFSNADYVYCGNKSYIGKVENTWVDGRYVDIDGYLSFYGNELPTKFDDHPIANILLHDITYVNVDGDTVTGDVLYKYDSSRDAWYAIAAYFCKSSYGYNGDIYSKLPSELILSKSDVAAMKLDTNSGKLPESGRIYDGTAAPGTSFSNVNASGVQFTERKVELTKGDVTSKKVVVNVLPANASMKKLIWISRYNGVGVEGLYVDLSEYNSGKSSEIKIFIDDKVEPGEYITRIATVDGMNMTDILVVVKPATNKPTPEVTPTPGATTPGVTPPGVTPPGVTPKPGDTVNPGQREVNIELIGQFVTRLYNVCLNREPDEDGKKHWMDQLANGQRAGIDTAYGFIFSQEFKNKNLCNEDYVEQLYQAFMGRASDDSGKADWVARLGTGWSREEVFNGFAMSQEFANICTTYGIEHGKKIDKPTYGTIATGPCTICGKADGVTSFVTRLYNVCLDREPDTEGLKDWCARLWNHDASGTSVSSGFVFSEEFQNRELSNDDYVEYMYKAFFGRDSDEEGKAYWVSKLNAGESRLVIFDGFVGSQEFLNLCNSYGIDVL